MLAVTTLVGIALLRDSGEWMPPVVHVYGTLLTASAIPATFILFMRLRGFAKRIRARLLPAQLTACALLCTLTSVFICISTAWPAIIVARSWVLGTLTTAPQIASGSPAAIFPEDCYCGCRVLLVPDVIGWIPAGLTTAAALLTLMQMRLMLVKLIRRRRELLAARCDTA